MNVAVNVQDADVASVPPAAEQDPAPEFAIEKSPEFPPVSDGEMEVAEEELLFVSVKVTGEEEEPTLTEPKFWEDGVSDTLVGGLISGFG